MPRVRIKETVIASSDTSGFYSNYAVLITGFTGRDAVTQEFLDAIEQKLIDAGKSDMEVQAELKNYTLDSIQPDSNGVYEFTSADDFRKTIGLKGPKVEVVEGARSRVEYHYGNQMTYELLKLGYPVVYRPIKTIKDMDNGSFWEIFKDKVNYDFRFISHGLLTSSEDKLIATLNARLESLQKAEGALEQIERDAGENATATKLDEEFDKIFASYSDFVDADGNPLYESFSEAKTAITDSIKTIEDQELPEAEANSVTTAVINRINGFIANLAFYAVDSTTGEPVSDVGRGDCIALLELDEQTYLNQNSSETATAKIIEAINELTDINSQTGGYCALTVPSVIYKMTEDTNFDKNKKFPAAFHYLACFINSLNSGFAEWYAAAGYTRGTASYIIDKTTVKLGEVAINMLEPRTQVDTSYPKFACNVITNFRGNYYLWGNRTTLQLESDSSSKELVASHFLNIRQLCTTVKKQLQVACRRFTFDPSSDTLWFNFVNAIKPTLEAMKADQGIRDYKIIKESVGAKKAAFKAKIRIIPIEAVEDFDLEVSLEDSFSDITVNEAN